MMWCVSLQTVLRRGNTTLSDESSSFHFHTRTAKRLDPFLFTKPDSALMEMCLWVFSDENGRCLYAKITTTTNSQADEETVDYLGTLLNSAGQEHAY
jgi:hypothetical protein